MSEVKRYAIHGAGKWTAVEVKAGAWVRWYDYDAAQSELAALREELSNTTSVAKSEIEGLSLALQASQERLAAAEQRNAFLEAQVVAKDVGIDFRDALINAVRMSSKELLMAWVPSDWEAKRRILLCNSQPTESGASE